MKDEEFIRRMKDDATYEHMHGVFWVQPEAYHRLIEIADEKLRLEVENRELRAGHGRAREDMPIPLQFLERGGSSHE